MEPNIYAQIRREANDFFDLSISPVPGYSFNQYETIKRCILYHNSRYEDNSLYLNRQKLFFNVVNPPCEVASKQLKVDAKNIRLWPMSPKSNFSTYLLEKELREWLKKSEFSEILNRIAEEAPIFGSVALEKTKKGAELVDLRRLILDPSVETIEQSRFVTTIHYMTPAELRETGWDNVEVAIERFGNNKAQAPFEDNQGDLNLQTSSPYIKVFKRYGEVPESWLKGGKSDKKVKALFIVAGPEELQFNAEGKIVGELGVELFKSKWTKEWPFRDFHYTKTKGRWLGVGVIEMLFDVQERINEIKNQRRISMEISSTPLFQTKDRQIVRNVLTDLEPGDLLISKTGIEPIVNEERNLQAYNDEEESYKQQVERLTFAYEAIRGETPPSSTPLGTTQIVTSQGISVFGFKSKNLTIFLREFFNELVLPSLLAELRPEHVMRFTGSSAELAKLDEAAAELYANDLAKEAFLNRKTMTKEGAELKKQLALKEYKKMGSNRFLKIKEALYDNIEYEFDFVIDNEQVDPQTLAMNLQRVIADLSGNPMLLDDPRLKLLYFKFAEKLGINSAELEMADQEAGVRNDAMAQQNAQQAQQKPTMPMRPVSEQKREMQPQV